jgi:uncharacterized hydrophobic protein (TIGR00271 family)
MPTGGNLMEERSFGSAIRLFFNMSKSQADVQVLKARIDEGARIDGLHVCQLIAAMIIASIGLNVDSVEAIIGAMLICPLMGSVLAIAFSIASLDAQLLKEAIKGPLLQMAVCLFTSTFYFSISPLSNQTSELLTNANPTIWDVVIALVGGFAGALGFSRKQEPSTLIAGVAVATALMPPLCATGYGIAMRDIAFSLSALYEFLINVVFIAFGAELVLISLHVPMKVEKTAEGIISKEELEKAYAESHKIRMRLIVCSVIFAIPCLLFSAMLVQRSIAEKGSVFETQDPYETEYTTKELRTVCPQLVGFQIGENHKFDEQNNQLQKRLVAIVETSSELADDQETMMKELIELNVSHLDMELEVRFEIAKTN